MSVVQEYNDWQELVTKIKETQVRIPLEDNILNDVEVVLDQDLLTFRNILYVRYKLNGTVRKVRMEIDRDYGMGSEDPIRERIMLVEKLLIKDLAEFMLYKVLGKIDPTKI
jgi:hypothetical protein